MVSGKKEKRIRKEETIALLVQAAVLTPST